MPEFTYPEIGATRGGPLPAGYRHLAYRTRLRRLRHPSGDDLLPVAAEAILTWRLHRRIGLRFEVAAPRATAGVQTTTRLGLGRLAVRAPCEVVWAEAGDDLAGFGYGTLLGHPVIGEESFVASRGADGTVWFTVTSFSRPAAWYTRAAGPLMPVLQQAYARRCGQVLKRLCR